ncbi:MAG: ornithine--acyl-ACP N-acyltransferase OlsB, partial [Polymorphum sp.]|nr:ornithine--acyl-ACP N-acyltransferase OlsB [Polymorphum sp.]
MQKFVPMMGEQGISARFFPGFAKPLHGETSPAGDVSLGRVGSLEVRLARTAREVKKAQRLRYHVFYEEMSAIADAQTLAARRDMDAFDAICDHLLVVDHASMKRNKLGRLQPQIVGTYRLLRQEVAEAHGGFYTASEYD